MSANKAKEYFINKAIAIHGDKYDYSLVNYTRAKDKVEIICPIHGVFLQSPHAHTSGYGCIKCGGRAKWTTEDFIKESKDLNGDIFTYSKVNYINNKTDVTITCKEHGDFKVKPTSHIHKGVGCPTCSKIRSLNNKVKSCLESRNWDFEQPEDHKLIPISSGKLIMVDNEDFDRLKDIPWTEHDRGYAYNRRFGMVHRFIMSPPDHLVVDHRDGNPLNNLKNNLRVCPQKNNSQNSRSSKGSSSLTGVSYIKKDRKWRAYITPNGVQLYLGTFEDEEEAGKVRDLKAIELWGDFAYLNFPELKEEYLKILIGGKE